LFTPPSVEGTVVLPGFDGGGEWGGAAVDRESGVIYVNASDVPWIAAMRPAAGRVAAAPALGSGAAIYQSYCAGCHGPDRKGDGDRVPSLVGIGRRRSPLQIRRVIEHGRGFMPAFNLSAAEETAVVNWLRDLRASSAPTKARAARAQPAASSYEFAGYERWRDPDGYPAIKPPWGTLSAIDLNTGEYRWRITLGEHPELTAKGVAPTGTEQYGGPIVTAGGLVFIGATTDAKFRAFDKVTGRLLWEAPLPAPAFATPSTYMVAGKQYVVIAAGGGKLGTPSSDTYVSFALP
jgi:quinoprotein glucose dehydrogenase